MGKQKPVGLSWMWKVALEVGISFTSGLQGFAGATKSLLASNSIYETMKFMVSMRTLLVLELSLSKIWELDDLDGRPHKQTPSLVVL